MVYTNTQGLPEEFCKAVSVERHNRKGCYSATTLNHGIKEILLTDRHYDELTADVSDNIWAIFGTAVHAIMETQDGDNFKEEFFEVPVSNSKVTGRVDSYDMEHEVLYDWKTASVWKVKMQDFTDWDQQGLTYAWLMKQSGLEVRKIVFVALLKDHSKSKARTEHDYPKSPVYRHEVEVTQEKLDATGARIVAKVRAIESCLDAEDDAIPACDEHERWASPAVYAVMKKGRKSALRLCDTEEAAKAYMAEKGGDEIVYRPGESRKCADYCVCRDFCDFWKKNNKSPY